MARPKIEIDEAIVKRLAMRFCPKTEIAAVVGVSIDTLDRRFADQIPLWREEGKADLRSKQWKAAAKGSNTMLIWLGKQYLGQKDQLATEVDDKRKLPDPIVAYTADPALRERALQLGRDLANGNGRASDTAPVDARADSFPRLAIPPAPPNAGGNGDGVADEPDNEPPVGSDSG